MKLQILTIVSLISLLFAQQEAGDYDRSSLSYIDRLFAVDGSVTKLQQQYQNQLIEQMSKQLTLPRYDQNPIPESLKNKFHIGAQGSENSCNGNRDLCLSSVTDLMNEVVTPPILDIVEMNRDIRAMDRMTEQQRNSFIVDKAKELGFSEDEVRRVMNSAYIFMPFASNYTQRQWKDTTISIDTVTRDGKQVVERTRTIKEKFSTSMKMGLVWWKIIPGDSTKPSRLQGFEPLMDSSSKTIELTRETKINRRRATTKTFSYKINNKPVDPYHYAWYEMVRRLGTDFGTRLRDFEDFKLSGQILERSPNFVGIDIGAREGIAVDDVFWIMASQEVNGKIVTERDGWVMVRDIADSSSPEGYKSQAQIIAGSPYIGAVLQEQVMASSRSAFQIQTVPYRVTSKADSTSELQGLKLYDGTMFRLELAERIRKNSNASQFYIALGAGFSVGSAKGSISAAGELSGNVVHHKIESVVAGHYDLSFIKRFSIRRVSLAFQTGGGYQHFNYKLDEDTTGVSLTEDAEYHLKSDAWGGFSSVFADISFTPSVAIGGGVGYRYFGETNEFTYRSREGSDGNWKKEADISGTPTVNQNGMTISAYITVRPMISLRGDK